MTRCARVLIIDDDDMVIRGLRRLFYRTEIPTIYIIARNREQALRQFERAAFDLVICDVRMPDVYGPDLIKELSEIYEIMPPVVFATGSRAIPVEELLAAGAVQVIHKPVDYSHIKALMEEYQPEEGEEDDEWMSPSEVEQQRQSNLSH